MKRIVKFEFNIEDNDQFRDDLEAIANSLGKLSITDLPYALYGYFKDLQESLPEQVQTKTLTPKEWDRISEALRAGGFDYLRGILAEAK